MNLNGGILGKVSVVDRGKALVYRGQSQKLSLACSVGKKKKNGGKGISVWEPSPAWRIQARRVRHCSQAESVWSLHYFSRHTSLNSGRGRQRLMDVTNVFDFFLCAKPSIRDFMDRTHLITVRTYMKQI